MTGDPSDQNFAQRAAAGPPRAGAPAGGGRVPAVQGAKPPLGQAALVIAVGLGIVSITVLFVAFFVFVAVRSATLYDVARSAPQLLWTSSVLLLVSSASFEASRLALRRIDTGRSARMLWVTAGLGAAFVVVQAVVWLQLYRQGYYAREQVRVGLLYLITAVHAVHVFGGLGVLGYVLSKRPDRQTPLEEVEVQQGRLVTAGVYWHAMGGIWVLIFVVLLWQGI